MKRIIFVAATAVLAFASVAQASDNTYFWLHPKLGMVQVDKATNYMVTSAPPQAKGARTTLWIDPKGNVRRIPIPEPASEPKQ